MMMHHVTRCFAKGSLSADIRARGKIEADRKKWITIFSEKRPRPRKEVAKELKDTTIYIYIYTLFGHEHELT